MNLIRIKIGMIGTGIIIFGYIFGYVLNHTEDTRLFARQPDVVGVGLAGLGLAIIIGILMSISYLIIVDMIDDHEEWKRNNATNRA